MSDPSAQARASAEQIQRALALIHGGQLPQAEALCRQVLVLETQNFNALQLLGHIALRQRDYLVAVRWLSAALSVNPGSAPVHSNLAVALLALRRPREALDCCDAALRLKPYFPEALCNRGNSLCLEGRLEEALASYEQAIAFGPGFYDAYAGRTNALLTLKRYQEALRSSDQALQIRTSSSDAWILRGTVLLQVKRAEEALAAFDRALSCAPNSPEALNNRGTALRDLRRPQEALDAYERAARQRPAFAEVWCNVANLSLDAGRYEEALGHCEQALRVRPDFLEALNIRGTALRLLKRYEEAASTYEKILAASPFYGQALSHLLSTRAYVCDWRGRAEQASCIIERVAAGESASAPHAFLWICDSAEVQLQCAGVYSRDQFPAAAPLWRGEKYRHPRTRIAYLSADFSDHPVAHLLVGVVERHDRSRFETFGISLHRDPDAGAMGLRMERAFEHFDDVSEVGDREVAVMLREREIDIAVDLTGHTRGGRLGILAFRAAPLQINFLGFAGTSGASYVDYLIGDSIVIPSDQERYFSERIIRMPHAFLPNDDHQPIAGESPRRRDLGLPETGFVFCAFNNTYKINPDMFEIWMRLLKETSGSVLWLRGGEGTVLANLRREAEACGVAAERLVFAPRIQAMDAHLARYRQADLFLDTLPYGAHATARDALWTGLPVLTCAGNSFAGRVAASLLTALEMLELVTDNLEEYAVRALTLASSPALLAEVRAKLAHQLATRPVFDTDLYRRHLESAFLTLCERQRRGESPETFSVCQVAGNWNY
jgi:predicted O-linked N-acetylglucosamine transferase (SPINDLY family)